MAEPRVGPCTVWATESDLCSPCDEAYGWDAVVLSNALTQASEFLYEASGAQFSGLCEETVRPCAQRIVNDLPVSVVGFDRAVGVCGCGPRDRCGCGSLNQIILPRYPIVTVDEVRVRESVGGALETLTSGAADGYRVDEYQWLVRLNDAEGNNDGWPCCQDLAQSSSGDGVFFEVTYTWGREPPALGVQAAADLACQMALACSPETVGECKLPARTQQVVRQGVTVTIIASDEFIRDLKLSVPSVGLFLQAYNPNDLRRSSVVLSPDVGPSARRVGT